MRARRLSDTHRERRHPVPVMRARSQPATFRLQLSGAKLPQEAGAHRAAGGVARDCRSRQSHAVVAALEGLFFGCGPADLYEARVRRAFDSESTRPPDTSDRSWCAVAAPIARVVEGFAAAGGRRALERILDDTGHALLRREPDARRCSCRRPSPDRRYTERMHR